MCVIVISFNCTMYMDGLYTSLGIKYYTIIQLLGNNQYKSFFLNNIILILNQDELSFGVNVRDIKVLYV